MLRKETGFLPYSDYCSSGVLVSFFMFTIHHGIAGDTPGITEGRSLLNQQPLSAF